MQLCSLLTPALSNLFKNALISLRCSVTLSLLPQSFSYSHSYFPLLLLLFYVSCFILPLLLHIFLKNVSEGMRVENLMEGTGTSKHSPTIIQSSFSPLLNSFFGGAGGGGIRCNFKAESRRLKLAACSRFTERNEFILETVFKYPVVSRLRRCCSTGWRDGKRPFSGCTFSADVWHLTP